MLLNSNNFKDHIKAKTACTIFIILWKKYLIVLIIGIIIYLNTIIYLYIVI